MAVKAGEKVKVEYVGKLNNGTVFDKSEEGKPLEFTVGEGKLIPDFERAVEGMNVGETKTITIPAEHAYGKRDETLVRRLQRSVFPDNINPEKGMAINLYLPNGAVLAATIVDITDNEVVVDLNHPLADKDLTFDIKVVGAEPAKEKVAQ